jgi:hypothetical protein
MEKGTVIRRRGTGSDCPFLSTVERLLTQTLIIHVDVFLDAGGKEASTR